MHLKDKQSKHPFKGHQNDTLKICEKSKDAGQVQNDLQEKWMWSYILQSYPSLPSVMWVEI